MYYVKVKNKEMPNKLYIFYILKEITTERAISREQDEK